MKTWWLWRLKPHPKRRIAADLELPVLYVTGDATYEEGDWLTILGSKLRRRGIPDNGHVRQEPIGRMRAFKITIDKRGLLGELRGKKAEYWLTPPVEQFLDAAKHLPEATLRFGAPATDPADRQWRYRYWINREVFDATGEFLGGGLEGIPRVIDIQGVHRVIDLMQEEGETNELGNLMLVALDSYLAGDRPDPRFNPRDREQAARRLK